MEAAIRDATPPEPLSVTHRFYSPERLNNGREVGAWCYGLACGIFQPIVDRREPILVVEIPRDKIEGAAAVIVAAGGTCQEVSMLDFGGGMPISEGGTLLRVALGM